MKSKVYLVDARACDKARLRVSRPSDRVLSSRPAIKCLPQFLSSALFDLLLREGFKKSKWKFKMAFAIRRPTPQPPPLMAKFPDIFLPHFFSFAIESYIYETDFTLQKYHF